MRTSTSPIEHRCAKQTSDYRAHDGQLARTCHRCGCVWLDYPDGRDAHQAVFGHGPQPQQPVDGRVPADMEGRDQPR